MARSTARTVPGGAVQVRALRHPAVPIRVEVVITSTVLVDAVVPGLCRARVDLVGGDLGALEDEGLFAVPAISIFRAEPVAIDIVDWVVIVYDIGVLSIRTARCEQCENEHVESHWHSGVCGVARGYQDGPRSTARGLKRVGTGGC